MSEARALPAVAPKAAPAAAAAATEPALVAAVAVVAVARALPKPARSKPNIYSISFLFRSHFLLVVSTGVFRAGGTFFKRA